MREEGIAKIVYHSWLKFLVLNLDLFPDKPCLTWMRPGFSTAYASRREAFEGEAMSSSGHRPVPPK